VAHLSGPEYGKRGRVLSEGSIRRRGGRQGSEPDARIKGQCGGGVGRDGRPIKGTQHRGTTELGVLRLKGRRRNVTSPDKSRSKSKSTRSSTIVEAGQSEKIRERGWGRPPNNEERTQAQSSRESRGRGERKTTSERAHALACHVQRGKTEPKGKGRETRRGTGGGGHGGTPALVRPGSPRRVDT